MINTLKYVRILEKAGVPRDQAEIHVQLMSEALGKEMVTHFGTKTDLLRLEGRIESEVNRLESKIESEVSRLESKIEFEIKRLESKIESEVNKLESRLIIKMGAMMTIIMSLGFTIMTYVQSH